MVEVRTTLATAGAALMALGIGLVVLADAGRKPNPDEAILGWVLVSAGIVFLVVALAGAGLAMRKAGFKIDCGTGESFQKKILGQDRHLTPSMNDPISEVRVTRLRIRECTGRSAQNVKVQVIATHPSDTTSSLPKILPYVDGSLVKDFGPGDGHHVRLCEEVIYGYGKDARPRLDSHVPNLDSRQLMEIYIRPMVDGHPGAIQRFKCEWPDGAQWPTVQELTT
jgi:hypothetical protein